MSATASSAPGSNPQKPFQTKLVLLGEAAVGKSSVVLRFVSDDFQENKEPTIGAAFLTQKCRLEDKIIKFEIWDTAGQERFHSLAPMYYRNAQASIVVYDVLKANSYDKAKSWVKELQRQANANIIIALVGNKIDLLTPTPEDGAAPSEPAEREDEDEAGAGAGAGDAGDAEEPPVVKRAISREEAEAYAKEAGLLFFETSAKTGAGVEEVFTEIAKKIPMDEIIAQRARQNAAASGSAGQQRGNRVDLNSAESRSEGCNC